MSRHVTISAIGFDSAARDFGSGDDAVRRVIDYLREQVALVAPQQPDLVVLPEMCDVTHAMACDPLRRGEFDDFLRRSREPVMQAMGDLARAMRCYLVYPTYHLVEDGSRRNSAYLLDRAGRVLGRYDKQRPTISELEEDIVPGHGPVVLACDFGNVGMAICFDLNFEEVLRSYRELRPDVIIFPSLFHGGLMQAHWAYACRSHLVSAVGPTALPSEIYLPTGALLAASTNYFHHVTARVNLDCAVVHLDGLFNKLDAMRRRYGPALRIDDPGRLGSVLLSAESDALTIRDVLDAFDLATLDEYLDQSRERAQLALPSGRDAGTVASAHSHRCSDSSCK